MSVISNQPHYSRRSCLIQLAQTALFVSALSHRGIAFDSESDLKNVLIFVKPLQELSFADLANRLTEWKVGGIEATVREGGWITSKNAGEMLPRLMDELHRVGRSKVILASDINSIEDPDVELVLQPAAKLGVRFLRMKYYKYDLSKPILPQIDKFVEHAKGLAKVCQELDVVALYQNHAGAEYFGAPLWDIANLLEEVQSPYMRLAIDTRHTPLEATEAWKLNLARVKDLIGSIYVKDGIVRDGKIIDVPLGKGTAARPIFQRLWKENQEVPLCLHMEHMDHRDVSQQAARIDAVTNDLKVLREWMHG